MPTAVHDKHDADEVIKKFREDDIAQMCRVISYVQRHLAQRPGGNITHTHWHYSLLNWGHEPGKGQH